MERYIQIGQWIFELKQVRAIRAPEFGQPYDASAYITIADGVPHIEGLLTKADADFSRNDYLTFTEFFNLAGFDFTQYSQMKDGTRIQREKTVHE